MFVVGCPCLDKAESIEEAHAVVWDLCSYAGLDLAVVYLKNYSLDKAGIAACQAARGCKGWQGHLECLGKSVRFKLVLFQGLTLR